MKTLLGAWCALLVTALLVPDALAQPGPSGSLEMEETIRALENEEREAVLAGDTTALERALVTSDRSVT